MNGKSTLLMRMVLHAGVLVLLFGCASYTTVREHPEFASRRGAIRTAMLVLPTAEVTRRYSDGSDEALVDPSMRAAKDLSVLVAEELSRRGFEVKSGTFEDSSIDGSKKEDSPTTSIKRMHEELAIAMYGREPLPESRARDFRFSLGPEFAEFAKQAPANAYVFVLYREFRRTAADSASETGQKLLIGMLTAGLVIPPKDPSGWAVLQVTLIDGATGDVLWGNQVTESSFSLVTEPDFHDDTKDMVADLFKPFPR
ncbi:MAG: hypothetical protein ACREXY_02020 [Gammaproteobacteria bacterium]